jgi:beta-glucosidase-like glycosyl hydrolase/CubicO group peptidase (beta-lactamase class C family)
MQRISVGALGARTTFLWALIALTLGGCAQPGLDKNTEALELSGPRRPIFLEEATNTDFLWADSLIDANSIAWQLGQLFMVPLYSRELHGTSFDEVQALVRDHFVGGVICMQGEAAIQRQHLAELDSLAAGPCGVGLLTSMDAEWGAAMRLSDGLGFPRAMAIGATANPLWAQAVGVAVGQSLKLDGIDVDFAPVADVNNNPANPVIGTRSYGSDPALVGVMATAFSRGLQAGGVMGCGKHFPGHGDTDIDSHHGLPLITGDSTRLSEVELPPFRDLVYGGVDGMMTAHLVVPGLDSTSGLPASLSPIVVGEMLRGNGPGALGFEGLIFTDALTMAGAADAVPPGKREVLALLAGNDVLLFPSDVPLALDSLKAAVASGLLDSAVVRAACRRVLLAGRWADRQDGQGAQDSLDTQGAIDDLQKEIRAAMLTVVQTPHAPESTPTSFPLPPYTRVSVLNLNRSGAAFCAELRKSVDCDCVHHKNLPSKKDWPALIKTLAKNSLVIVNVVDESNRPDRRFGVPAGLAAFLSELEQKSAVGLTLFTSPYAAAHVGDDFSGPVMIAYHQDKLTLEAAARAWSGTGDAMGQMPVAAGPWALGDGQRIRMSRLPRAGGHWSEIQVRLDSLMNDALDIDAFPGARLLVLHRGEVQVDASYGHLDASKTSAVAAESVYDLASITKVAATTVLTAQAVESGLIDLDAPIATMHPAELNKELGTRNLRQILSHTAGLPSWIPFYQSVVAANDSTATELYACKKSEMLEQCAVRIADLRAMDCRWVDTLRNTIYNVEPLPAGRYRYSDLGYYLLQEILESRLGAPLDELARKRIYAPLRLSSIGYTPADWSRPERIAPTELDTIFRMEMVCGRVHDPGAAMLGGVAGHAGLFSDAHDLALLMECLRMGGEWYGTRILGTEALAVFTERTWPETKTRRGLGWDKPGLDPDTGASSDQASWQSFGHSGFTGTLAWTDPEAELTFIFLSNRIHPDPTNKTLIQEGIRTKAMSIVYGGIGVNSRFK